MWHKDFFSSLCSQFSILFDLKNGKFEEKLKPYLSGIVAQAEYLDALVKTEPGEKKSKFIISISYRLERIEEES